MNERIRVREVRVIGADGEQLGVMAPEEALAIAREGGLDLVEVAATSRPPVCRIMDYGKYKYEQKKKSASKKSHAATLKEVKLRPGTDQHDLNFKLNNARKFLMEGDKVKITVMFRGREMVHTYRGREQLDEVLKQLGSIAKVESTPRMEGRFMSMIVVGDRDAIAEARRQQGIAAASSEHDESASDDEDEAIDDEMDDDDDSDEGDDSDDSEGADDAESEVDGASSSDEERVGDA
ncbi:MAG: translation initiation factor IF-3 [Deltaproteobacteria bacterium]|nr:translation initiation factor IF-3 [Deltaproteobacteria bacterium]